MFPEIKIPFKLLAGTAFGGLVILLLAGSFMPMWNGLVSIYLHPSLLITDYLAIGGLHATLVNVWLVTWSTILLLHQLKVKFSGVAFAGVITILAFSFFGKNLFNIIPVWLGFYLYAKLKGTRLNQYTGTFLFSTGIAPVTSFIMFGIPGLALWVAVPLGILGGLIAGCLTPMVVSIVGKFHQGYNLYNTGFGLGFIAMIFTAVLKAFQINVSVPTTLSFAFHDILFWLIAIISISLIGSAFFIHRQAYKPWLRLLQNPGNLPSDFYKDYGLAATLLNVGSIGFLSLILLIIYNIPLSGPIVASVFTFMGFGAYGKHIRNSLPVVIGLVLASSIQGFSLTLPGPSIALLFVTALAPVGGKFGIFYGVLAGFVHLLLAPQAFALQGGFDLYNNGFTAGLVAGVIVVIAQQFPIPPINQWFKKTVKH
ncbi:MAG: DUF1576 domain-containing protein [Firmicutes bacterium]|nr:DUF1576 domain-containing protein [Bacillota bacterium]